MSAGFNTDVEYGGERYHVQTELSRRPPARISTAIFRAGAVQWSHRTELHEGSLGDHERLVVEQHDRIVRELREGAMRGFGPALEIEWSNPGEAPDADGALRLRLLVHRGGVPASGSRLRGGFAVADLQPDWCAGVAASDGQGEVCVKMPAEAAAAILILEAESGISRGRREFRLASSRTANGQSRSPE